MRERNMVIFVNLITSGLRFSVRRELNIFIMSSKRRTKKQKILAGTRRTPLTLQTTGGNTQFSIVTEIQSPKEEVVNANPIRRSLSHTYVIHDARNTITITLILIAFDISIYFLLKQAIINIPGIGF